MKFSVLGTVLLIHHSSSYYAAQYGQVAPLTPTRDLCVNMIPPFLGNKPYRNRFPLRLLIDSQWITFKRLSVCAYSPPERSQAFAGMMVQIMKNNLPFGEFETDPKAEITDCPPGKSNLACLRSSNKLYQAAVNWVSPPDFDVHKPQLQCVVTIIALNQNYWTITFPVEPAPHKYPEYGNFTSEMKHFVVDTVTEPSR